MKELLLIAIPLAAAALAQDVLPVFSAVYESGVGIRALARAAAGTSGAPWACRTCGEQLEPQFTQCWRCGGERGASEQNEGPQR